MSEQTLQWQALAAQRGIPLSDYLREVLEKAPDQLSTIAQPLGLLAIAPQTLSENWRFDLLALPQALIHNALPVDNHGEPCLVLATRSPWPADTGCSHPKPCANYPSP